MSLRDADGFRRFYADALPRIYGYFLHRCGADTGLAEDLTQETFLAAVAELRRGITVTTPMSWIIGIARHKLLDHLRRQRRAGWTMISWESAVDGDDTFFMPGENDEAARARAVTVLSAVPLSQREALILYYLDGLSVPEVARLLERSVHATESLLARGRAHFRQAFAEAGDD